MHVTQLTAEQFFFLNDQYAPSHTRQLQISLTFLMSLRS